MSSWRSIPTQDRISDLPDSLICHILSFLPTKLAITTSVLSKRWNPLWRSVFTLHFDENTSRNFITFRRFVDSVFDSRDDTLPILSFRIKCGYFSDFDRDNLSRFVQVALRRGIQNLNINLSNFSSYDRLTPVVFSHLITCKTLVVLKLKNFTIHHVPQSVNLPLLKTLNLVSIFFMTRYVNFKRLFYGCPILENLQTNGLYSPYLPGCNSDSEGDYKAFPKLVRANLSNFRWVDLRFTLFHNVKFLRVELELLSTHGYQVPTFHNLTNLELIFKTGFSWSNKWKWVIQVLQHCPKLQHLTIDEASRDMPKGEDWEYPKIVPECLSSQFRTCMLKGLGYNDIECELQFAKYIMLNSKILCTMTIKSSSLVSKKAKDQMLVRLSSYLRGSATCKLLVD